MLVDFYFKQIMHTPPLSNGGEMRSNGNKVQLPKMQDGIFICP